VSAVCPGCGGDHSDLLGLTGGPADGIIRQSADTFRALVTMRIGQVANGEEEVDEASLFAAMEPIREIATVIMFFRHTVRQTEGPEDAEEHEAMIQMLRAVETVTSLATMGPMLLADQVMAMYAREWTPREKFAERWADEAHLFIPNVQND
jgi:hypothetical protein